MDSAEVLLRTEKNDTAVLTVSRLPSSTQPIEKSDRVNGSVVLREASAYRYELSIDEHVVALEPAELFDADDATRCSGRLLPGEAVGIVSLNVTTESGRSFRGRFDVRAAKFADEQAFATMLSDLATLSVESLHQGFAPSAGQFSSAAGPLPHLEYQQFAILNALLTGGDLRWAIELLLARPHTAWETELEPRQPGRPLRGSSRLSTLLSRPGPRVSTPLGPLGSLPSMVLVQRTDETLDTIPNRYIRFVLERWRALAASVFRNAHSLGGASRRRGISQAGHLIEELDEILGRSLFREVGGLSVFPGDNQVLRRREGYRQVASAAALVDGSLGLDLSVEDPFLVSRKSIATLYEYWTFVRLAGAVARAFGSPGLEGEQLWTSAPSGMSLVLKAGASTRLKFETAVGDQAVRGDLFFNKEFRGDSWTRPMRPDASLVLRVPESREMWLHFDAKYKVDWQRPFETGDPEEEEDAERAGFSKRTDLLKMHAYRDAIRNSAGSYVLFPGSEIAEFSVHQSELLPGLGAFPLRPDQVEPDSEALETFISRAIRHVAAPGTRHRRAGYWTTRAYEDAGTLSQAAASPVGDLPPADTPVLLGYVRSEEQWAWIRRNRMYNLRSGVRPGALGSTATELDSSVLVLYGREGGREVRELYRRAGPWEGITAQTIRQLGYPHPHGEAYLVTLLQPLVAPTWLDAADLLRLLPDNWMHGRPISITWLDLVLSAA